MLLQSYAAYTRLILRRRDNISGLLWAPSFWLKILRMPLASHTLQKNVWAPMRSDWVLKSLSLRSILFRAFIKSSFFKWSFENGPVSSKSWAQSSLSALRGQISLHFVSTSENLGKYTLATGWNLSLISKKKPIILSENRTFLQFCLDSLLILYSWPALSTRHKASIFNFSKMWKRERPKNQKITAAMVARCLPDVG